MSFEFLDYGFDKQSGRAEFHYRSEGEIFVEKVQFDVSEAVNYDEAVLDSALFLALVVLGTSYYKVRAGRAVKLPRMIDARQAEIFDKIYQEGLSQFAFENKLTREDLAEFVGEGLCETARETMTRDEDLVLASGGKDSLLLMEMLREQGRNACAMYITAQESYPAIIDEVCAPRKPLMIRREIDKAGLKRAGGMNGHVPVTVINEALAVVQAVISGYDSIKLGIGMEGVEPHAWIGDLPVNHQWSKTAEAVTLMREYLRKYVTSSIEIDLPLSEYDELAIAKMFAEKCWDKYGRMFSSCNVANYKQDANNRELKWCGKCAKCANSYLLFAPFVPYEEQLAIFGHDLFTDSDLTEIYKGLLGVDDVMKPFECIASIKELRKAYAEKLPGYGDLPFEVPAPR